MTIRIILKRSNLLNLCRPLQSSIAGVSTLVLAEHLEGQISPTTYSVVAAAAQLKGQLSVLISGKGAALGAAAIGSTQGVDKVLVAEHEVLQHQTAEPLSNLVAQLQSRRGFTHILAPSSSFGKDLLPRAAALLNCQPVSDIIQIIDANTYLRPIYAGNALSTVKYTEPGLRMLLIRPTSFRAAASPSANPASVESVSQEELEAAASVQAGSEWENDDVRKSERPDLGSAKVVVCGGRALKSAEGFKMLDEMADLLGGAVGASRAAVDAGYVPNDLQVGQTGKVVAPDLYIGIGISGAIQHLAGMKDSRTIVAINTDADAPIFQVADYGLVQDLFTAVPQLNEAIKKVKTESQ